MTMLFDRLSVMRHKYPDKFKKVAVMIINDVMTKVNHGEFGKSIRWLSQDDCDNADRFIDYLGKIRRVANGESGFLTGYKMLDFMIEDPDLDAVWEFIDNFHDLAHNLAREKKIESDSLIFGFDVMKTVVRII